MWLEREAATVVNDFEYRANVWGSWSPPPAVSVSLEYSRRQESVWRELYKDAVNRLRPLLEV